MIRGVAKVLLPVANQVEARDFWVEKMGFTLLQDSQYGDERWVEVGAPDGQVILVLTPRTSERPRVEPASADLPHSDVFFGCDDVVATHRELSARGVEFPAEPREMFFGWWAMFADQEGTRYALGDWPRRERAAAGDWPR